MGVGIKHVREIFRRCRSPLGFALFIFIAFTSPGRSQGVSQAYSLKAVFLLNFAQFTDWPTTAFAAPAALFVIGILGSDPFGHWLDEAVAAEFVNGRKVVVERYRRVEELQSCQILFITESKLRELPKIMAVLRGKSVLTVSDVDTKLSGNVSVRFVTDNNKIRFKINTDAVKAANLIMSSKLLRVAELVSAQTR